MNNIFGCFLKIGFNPELIGQEAINLAASVRPYIFGNKGIGDALKVLKYDDYGKDLVLILLEFYVKPSEEEINKLKQIGNYRKKEKSIGIPIIIDDENFFIKSEEERFNFLKETILQKMDLLEELVKEKKLDLNVELLKINLEGIL